MKFSLPAASLSRAEIEEIQKFTVNKFLSATGYDHSMHRSVVFGPTNFGGVGMRHLFTEMMEMKLNTVLSHIRANLTLGKSMRINIDYIQLTSGMTTPIFESSNPIPYIEQNWLLHVRDYLIEINAKMQIENLWKIKPLRENDVILLDEISKCGATTRAMKTFNNWRMFFQINCLSEICNVEGTKIQPEYMTYPTTDFKKQSRSKITWPNQQKPGRKSFRTWILLLRSIININGINQLTNPLGSWNMENLQETTDWAAYYNNTNNLIAIPMMRGTDEYRQYILMAIRHRSISCPTNAPFTLLKTLPATYTPSNIQTTNHHMALSIGRTNTKIRHLWKCTMLEVIIRIQNEIISKDKNYELYYS
jgi:hypothetical protein